VYIGPFGARASVVIVVVVVVVVVVAFFFRLAPSLPSSSLFNNFGAQPTSYRCLRRRRRRRQRVTPIVKSWTTGRRLMRRPHGLQAQ